MQSTTLRADNCSLHDAQGSKLVQPGFSLNLPYFSPMFTQVPPLFPRFSPCLCCFSPGFPQVFPRFSGPQNTTAPPYTVPASVHDAALVQVLQRRNEAGHIEGTRGATGTILQKDLTQGPKAPEDRCYNGKTMWTSPRGGIMDILWKTMGKLQKIMGKWKFNVVFICFYVV